MPYEKLTWKNGEPPAINASNLNHIEEGVYQVSMDTVTDVTAQGSGSNLIITLSTNDPLNSHSFSFDAVTWLSASAFYSQSYIDSCFTEVTIDEN